MISNTWLRQRQPAWDRLNSLIHQAEKFGLKKLAAPELRELGLLYRQTASDLSAVRENRSARVTEEYLNRLVTRAHHYVYSGQKTTLRGVADWLVHDYPLIFRRLLPYTAGAVLIFLAGAVLGALLTVVRPEFMNLYLGPTMIETIHQHKMWTQSIVSVKPQASASILTNNISVTFIAFAGGIVGGLGTVALLFSNGMEMGVISTACAQNHMALSLWSFVAAHGAFELPAIFIAGGAGLRLGWALLFPGMLSRKESLVLGGSEAVRLLCGTVPMLIVAGLLEGFLSPSGARVGIKFAVSAALLTFLWFWLGPGLRVGNRFLKQRAGVAEA